MKNKIKRTSEVAEFKRRRLQLYRFEEPITQILAKEVLETINMDDVKLLSKCPNPKEIKGICNVHEGMYIGHGVCIAKKYLKYGFRMKECASCKSQEIVDQLNFIFKHSYDGIYRAEWAEKRRRRKKSKKD